MLHIRYCSDFKVAFILFSLMIFSRTAYGRGRGRFMEDLMKDFCPKESDSSLPNIVVILADDVGWNDVSWNNKDILTPNLEKLARRGVILDQYYTHPSGSGARAALLTGRYPFKIGFQHKVVTTNQPTGLPPEFETIAQKLKQFDYATHMIGKWRLGYCKDDFTPLKKGFDSFYGHLTSSVDWFTKLRNSMGLVGTDFRDNSGVAQDNTTYLEFLYQEQMKRIISISSPKRPFFLYYSSGMAHTPLLVPEEFRDLYPNINEANRKTFSGMVTVLDDTVGVIVDALKKKGVMDNTLIIFASDNGGDPPFGGNNFPLRGMKNTVYEGGQRVPAFVYNSRKMLKRHRYRSKELVNVVDWFNTILEAAGLETVSDIDSISAWKTISFAKRSERTEMVYNIDDVSPNELGAIRVGNYKLISGNPETAYPRWQNTTGTYPVPTADGQLEGVFSQCFNDNLCPDDNPLSVTELYNLKRDPFEQRNLAQKKRKKLKKLQKRLEFYRNQLAVAITGAGSSIPLDEENLFDPARFGGAFSPGWC